MKQKRRDFIKSAGILTGSAIAVSSTPNIFANKFLSKSGSAKMKLTFKIEACLYNCYKFAYHNTRNAY